MGQPAGKRKQHNAWQPQPVQIQKLFLRHRNRAVLFKHNNGMQITALFGILPFLSKEVTAASLMLKPFISGLAKFGSSIMNFMKKLGEV